MKFRAQAGVVLALVMYLLCGCHGSKPDDAPPTPRPTAAATGTPTSVAAPASSPSSAPAPTSYTGDPASSGGASAAPALNRSPDPPSDKM